MAPRRRSLLLKPSPKPSDLTPLLQMAAQKWIGFLTLSEPVLADYNIPANLQSMEV